MVQILLFIIKCIVVGLFGIAAIVFLIFTIVKWKKKSKYVFLPLTILSLILSIGIWNINLYEAESEDKDELIPAFVSNFGFSPPASIEDIKVKNVTVYDSDAHYMAFTYDSSVLNRITEEDTALKLADKNSDEFSEIISEIKKNNNMPDWMEIPNDYVDKIYYKRDFMNHNFSEFYLWANKNDGMVYLYVSYFD